MVISDTFRQSLIAKGVAPGKITRIYNPAARGFGSRVDRGTRPLRVIHIGNIGHSQALDVFVRAFEASPVEARLIIVGTGERRMHVVSEARSGRVEIRGLVSENELERELDEADIGLITQRPDVFEFNVPSRLMTLLARGIPVLAATRRDSEVRRLLERRAAQAGSSTHSPPARSPTRSRRSRPHRTRWLRSPRPRPPSPLRTSPSTQWPMRSPLWSNQPRRKGSRRRAWIVDVSPIAAARSASVSLVAATALLAASRDTATARRTCLV